MVLVGDRLLTMVMKQEAGEGGENNWSCSWPWASITKHRKCLNTYIVLCLVAVIGRRRQEVVAVIGSRRQEVAEGGEKN